MQMMIIGIDNGLDGGVSYLDPNGNVGLDVMPTVGGEGGGKRSYDIQSMVRILNKIRTLASGFGWGIHCYLEHAQAFPGQGVSSMFSVGLGFGLWQGILSALFVPYTLVRPQAWQKVMFEGLDRSDTKKCSALVVSRLYPGTDFRASDKCRKAHEGLTDATCIAAYGKKHYSTINP